MLTTMNNEIFISRRQLSLRHDCRMRNNDHNFKGEIPIILCCARLCDQSF